MLGKYGDCRARQSCHRYPLHFFPVFSLEASARCACIDRDTHNSDSVLTTDPCCLLSTYDQQNFKKDFTVIMSAPPPKSTPLVAPGHTRPVTHLSFSHIQDDGTFLLVSSCKDGNPMLREWTGDWIGTFLGHKGAVWSTKLSPDASRAASGSADFTA
jgi:WD40 repeat protein